MTIDKKELKEQEIRTLFITPALQQKGWAVSVNMREEYYFTDGRVLVDYTPDELHIIETPFYYDAHSHEPRYYQRIAVDRTIEAIDKTLAEIQKILGIDIKSCN